MKTCLAQLIAHPLRDRSIKTKLLLLSLASVGVALLLSCAGFTLNEFQSARRSKMDQLDAQARMLAFNCTGAMTFRDIPAARQLLGALQSQPTIEFACLYDGDGRVLATYPPHASPKTAPAVVGDEGCRFTTSGHLELWHRVVDRDEPLGVLFLRASLADLEQNMWHYGRIVIIVICVALMASVLLAGKLQCAISGPILRTAETAMAVTAAGDYSIRVECQSRDELGVLSREFNRMLQHVQTADSALQQAHDELEERVVERTAELRQEIAERERVQAELLKAKDAAEAANVAKSRFLANMSHEIRTPLNAILGFADLLRRGADDGNEAERHDYIDTIHTSGQHLLSLINDILDLSKIEADRLEVEIIPCSPHEILTEIVSVMRVRALEKGLKLEYCWSSPVPETIRTDPARFGQLLMNLVSNAVKFTKHGGVQIVARLDRAAAEPRLEVDVLDTGVGIAAEKFPAIFEPFVQADSSVTREFGGTGLGLTISRRIAEALGGSIRLTSEVGEGSQFTVSIPTGPLDDSKLQDTPPADALRAGRSPPDRNVVAVPKARVLLVEDGETNRKLIGLVLRRAGLDVISAENGQVGVEFATAGAFDLVLMDMQMPVMDGYTAARKLRQQGLTLPIIALTAHAMKGDADKCMAAGCTGYLTKPVDSGVLLQTVAEVLEAEGKSVAPAAAPAVLESSLPMDDPDFREIVEEFVQRLTEQLDAMRKALAGRDPSTLARLAHWLKGTGGTAGFPTLSESAKGLEQAAKTAQWEKAAAVLESIQALAERIVLAPAPVQADSGRSMADG